MKIGILRPGKTGPRLGTGLVHLGNTVRIVTRDSCKEKILLGLAIMVAAKKEKRRLEPRRILPY